MTLVGHTTTIREASKCGYAVGIWWRQEKNRTSEKTWQPTYQGMYAGDETHESQL